MKKIIPILLIALIAIPLIGTVSAASSDLTVIGISTTDGSSIKLGIEPGQQSQISFTNITWYIYGSGAVTESIDGNVTATHQVDGLLIVQSHYEAGRHVITFSSDGSIQQYTLMISETASSIDWDELIGETKPVPQQGRSEAYIWLVTIACFIAPLPFVYRRVRRIKRSEVMRIV